MTGGAEHFHAAEVLLDLAADQSADEPEREQYYLQKAHAHATLALAAAVDRHTRLVTGDDMTGYGVSRTAILERER